MGRLLVEDLEARGITRMALSVKSWGNASTDCVVMRRCDMEFDGIDDPALPAWFENRPTDQWPVFPVWGMYFRNVKKVYVGRGVKYFSNIGVAEFTCEAMEFSVGDKLLITGPTTGVMYVDVDEIRYDLKPVETAHKGQHVSFRVPAKIRPSDKLFKIVKNDVDVLRC
jgi:hypothetical protein